MTRRRILLPLLLAALFCACAPSRRTAAVHSRAENDLRMQVLREELSTRDSLFFRALCEELIRNLDGERHTQSGHLRHVRRQFGAYSGKFVVRYFEDEFVMHLHDQPGFQLLAVDPALHGDHCQLDEVGGGALHRSIDCRAFGALPAADLRGMDFRQP